MTQHIIWCHEIAQNNMILPKIRKEIDTSQHPLTPVVRFVILLISTTLWVIKLSYNSTMTNTSKLINFSTLYRLTGMKFRSCFCHTQVQLGIQSQLNSCKYHIASWATKWHDYVPVDHHHPPTRRVTWNLGTASFSGMEM